MLFTPVGGVRRYALLGSRNTRSTWASPSLVRLARPRFHRVNRRAAVPETARAICHRLVGDAEQRRDHDIETAARALEFNASLFGQGMRALRAPLPTSPARSWPSSPNLAVPRLPHQKVGSAKWLNEQAIVSPEHSVL